MTVERPKSTKDMLALLRPAFESKVMQIISQIYVEDLTTDEVFALAGLLRPVHARVQSRDRQPAVVLELIPRR